MYIAELLHTLVRVPHHEVVETALPHVSFFKHGAPQTARLVRSSIAKPAQEFARETLLEDLHHDRRRVVVGFADQEVNVFGHHHVADHNETISDAGLFEDAEEKIAALWCSQQRAALVAAEGDEVQIACSVTAPEPGGDGESLSQNLWERCDESPALARRRLKGSLGLGLRCNPTLAHRTRKDGAASVGLGERVGVPPKYEKKMGHSTLERTSLRNRSKVPEVGSKVLKQREGHPST